jgi:hypothetical protein
MIPLNIYFKVIFRRRASSMHLEKGLQYPIGPLGSVIVVVSCIMLSPHSCGLLLLKLELLLLQLSSYVGGGSVNQTNQRNSQTI